MFWAIPAGPPTPPCTICLMASVLWLLAIQPNLSMDLEARTADMMKLVRASEWLASGNNTPLPTIRLVIANLGLLDTESTARGLF